MTFYPTYWFDYKDYNQIFQIKDGKNALSFHFMNYV